MRAPPPSQRACDVLCGAAALWTLCCHAVVAYGGSLHHVLAAFAAAIVVAGAALIATRQTSRDLRSSSTGDAATADSSRARVARLGCGMLGAATVGVYAASGDAVLFWWGAAVTLALGLTASLWLDTPSPAPEAPQRGFGSELGLWGMAAACAFVVVIFHRVDLDTPFYVSLAVAAADAPGAELMLDTIHGVEGLGLHMPAHRIHSFELLSGALSYLSGWPALEIYTVVVPIVAAAFVPLAQARLFRLLAPGYWSWCVLAVLVVLVGGGGTMWWYGNFSVVRILHGKSVYLSIFLPLVYAYGMRFGAAPDLRRWLLLLAAQVAAVGCTSSALWSAPVAAGLAVAAGVRWDRRAPRTLLLGALSSAYVVGVGLTLAGDLAPVAARVVEPVASGAGLASALTRTLGSGRLAWFALGALVLAAPLLRPGPGRRFALVVPLGVLLFVLNPYAEAWVSRTMTGPSYWRALWALPLPTLMALALTAPLQRRVAGHRRWGLRAGVAAALVLFVVAVPDYGTLSRRNRTVPGELSRKVPGSTYQMARLLADAVPPGAYVVAPQKIAAWVPAVHRHPYVMYSREVYLQRIEREIGEEEARFRMLMSETVSGVADIEARIRHSDDYRERRSESRLPALFDRGLARYDIRGVCLNRAATHFYAIRERLDAEGFERFYHDDEYEIWAREGPRP